MKKFYFILTVLGFMFYSNGFAQNLTSRNCGTMNYLTEQLKKDPSLAGRMSQIEQQTNNFISSNKATGTTVVIPVVFHIVYNTTAQNISNAQCIAQLNQLNLDLISCKNYSQQLLKLFKKIFHRSINYFI
jgi:hypothetical protein